jgi:hypothetical protein
MKLSRGTALIPILIVLAILMVAAPLVMWVLGVAVNLLWLAIKLCGAVLVLLLAIFFIKVMVKKVQ